MSFGHMNKKGCCEGYAVAKIFLGSYMQDRVSGETMKLFKMH